MQDKIRVLFFDVDGTLLGPNRRSLDDTLLDAFQAARAKGIKLVVSTGRKPQELGILSSYQFDAYATLNGQVCFDGEGNVLRLNPVPRADVAKLVEILEEDPFACCFIELERSYMNMMNEQAATLYRQVSVTAPPIEDMHQALHNDIYQMNFFISREHEEKVLKQLPGVMARRWSSLHSDIIARSNGKRDGVEAILSHLGLKKQHAMSFGDGENDIEMFEATAISVAMGGASELVKSSASIITSCYDEDGVVRAMAQMGVI